MSNRSSALDVLKLIAAVGVITIHTSGYGVELFALGSFDWLVCVFWDSLARFAVPLFFMCTGALMLPPERELRVGTLYRRYFLRVLIILIFWSWAYSMFTELGTWALHGWHSEGFLWEALRSSLCFESYFHLYYLQILLLLYAALPALRVFTRSASREETRYALALWAFLGIFLPLAREFPPFEWLGGLWSQAAINMTWASLGYALLGHALNTREPRRRELPWFLAALALGLALTFGGTVFISLRRAGNFLGFMEGMSPGPMLMAAGLFGAVRILREGRGSSRTLTTLVRASFSVYLTHVFFVMIFRQLGFDLTLLPPVVAVPLETAAVALCSLALWWPLSKLPVVNKYLI